MLAREAGRLGLFRWTPICWHERCAARPGPAGSLAVEASGPLAARRPCTRDVDEKARHNLAALIDGGRWAALGHVGHPGHCQDGATGLRARSRSDAFSPFSLARAAWTGGPAIGQRRLRAMATRAKGRPARVRCGGCRRRARRDGGRRLSFTSAVAGHGPYSKADWKRGLDRVLGRAASWKLEGAMRRPAKLRRGHAALDRRGQGSAGLTAVGRPRRARGERSVCQCDCRVDAGVGASRGARGRAAF